MNNRYEFIDALRGWAVFGVIIVHVFKFIKLPPNTGFLYRITGEGARGVQLFFILSALTLFLSLYSSNYSGKIKDTIKYFLRRFFRIAPLFYSLLIFIAFFTFIKPIDFFSYVNKDLLNFLSTFTFTNVFLPEYLNNIIPVQWSIAVEMFFYLLVPIFFMRIKNISDAKKMFLYSIIIASILELLLPIFFQSLSTGNLQFLFFTSLPIQLPTFILGFISFFLLYNKNGERVYVDKKTILSTLKYILYVTFSVEIIFFLTKLILLKTVDISLTTPRIYIESAFLVCIIIALANGYLSILNNKISRFFGKISYSIYITHFFILMIISKKSWYISISKSMGMYTEYIFLLIIATISTSVVSYITYKLIEKPGQELGKYLIKKI